MRTTISLNGDRELRSFLRKKPLIKFPEIKKSKTFYTLLVVSIAFVILSSIVFHMIGYRNGSENGYREGVEKGEKRCLKENFNTNMDLKDAISFNIRYNLDKYIWWLGVVVGLAWIIHGVGFKLVG